MQKLTIEVTLIKSRGTAQGLRLWQAGIPDTADPAPIIINSLKNNDKFMVAAWND